MGSMKAWGERYRSHPFTVSAMPENKPVFAIWSLPADHLRGKSDDYCFQSIISPFSMILSCDNPVLPDSMSVKMPFRIRESITA